MIREKREKKYREERRKTERQREQKSERERAEGNRCEREREGERRDVARLNRWKMRDSKGREVHFGK